MENGIFIVLLENGVGTLVAPCKCHPAESQFKNGKRAV
jgi:hypothetical protein